MIADLVRTFVVGIATARLMGRQLFPQRILHLTPSALDNALQRHRDT